MFRYKHFPIAAVLAAFMLISFVGNSHAFEIEEMTTDSEDYNHGDSQGIWHLCHVKTSAPYWAVDWYIDDQPQKTSWGDSEDPQVDAYFWPYWLTGTITGKEYTIKAIAYPLNDEAPNGGTQVTQSYTLTVYQVRNDSSTKLDVWGNVTLYSLKYEHPYITPDGDAVAYNKGNEWNKIRRIFHRFVHQVTGPNVQREEVDETPGGQVVKLMKGKRYDAPIPSFFPIYIGDGESEQEYNSKVYMRLEVSGEYKVKNPNGGSVDIFAKRDWFVGADEWFTSE